MNSFDRDDALIWQRLDWLLIRNGAVALYCRPSVLEQDVGWLERYGYRVFEMQCSGWKTENGDAR